MAPSSQASTSADDRAAPDLVGAAAASGEAWGCAERDVSVGCAAAAVAVKIARAIARPHGGFIPTPGFFRVSEEPRSCRIVCPDRKTVNLTRTVFALLASTPPAWAGDRRRFG